MVRSINPFASLPFYEMADEIDWQCPVYSPTTALPPFQIKFPGVEVSAAVATVYHAETGSSQVFNVTLFNQDGDGYVEYQGDALPTPMGTGPHRVKLIIDGSIYVSHLIQASGCFDDLGVALDIQCTPGDETVYTASILSGGAVNEIAVNFGTGFEQIGNDEGTFLASEMPGTSVVIQARTYLGDAYFARQYTFTYDQFDPCSFELLESGVFSNGLERFSVFKWKDAADKPALGLIYSTGYENRLYLPTYRASDGMASDEIFVENGQGYRELASVAVARVLNLDVFPIPVALVSVITGITYHDTFSVHNLADDLPVENCFLAGKSFPDVEETECQKAALAIEYDRRFQAC